MRTLACSPRSRAILVVLALAAVVPASTAQSRDVTLAVPGRSNSTPWIAADGLFVALAWGGSVDGRADVFVAVSRDGGRTFGTPVRVNAVAGEARLGGELPPRVALTRATAGDPEIAVLWTSRGGTTSIKAARSHDGGRTFTPSPALQDAAAPGDRGWASLALDESGMAHAIWLDHRGLAARSNAGRQDGAHRHTGTHDGVAMAQRSALYHARLSPGSGERALTNGVCYCCKTALAAGPDGMLAAAWRHVYPGNQRDIAFSISRDRGRSFSAPVRVSPDHWEIDGCPDDGPAVAIDPRGTMHLVWPTVIGGANPEGALFYASSRDGRTFTPRLRISTLGSPRPMHPQIALEPEGRVFVAWDELLGGTRVAALRELTRSEGTAQARGDAVRLSDGESGGYPVLAWSDRGLLAAWTAGTGADAVVKVRQVAKP